MITLDKEFGTFYDIFEMAKNLAIIKSTKVSFPFNGVHFIVCEHSVIPNPDQIINYVRFEQEREVYL